MDWRVCRSISTRQTAARSRCNRAGASDCKPASASASPSSAATWANRKALHTSRAVIAPQWQPTQREQFPPCHATEPARPLSDPKPGSERPGLAELLIHIGYLAVADIEQRGAGLICTFADHSRSAWQASRGTAAKLGVRAPRRHCRAFRRRGEWARGLDFEVGGDRCRGRGASSGRHGDRSARRSR